MSTVRHKLMRRESERRLAAATLLKDAGDDTDSAYLLDLLAFELLLKLLVEMTTQSPAPTHHSYEKIFATLPDHIQTEVLRLAGERIGPSALKADHLGVLEDLGKNFVKLRYPYEKYSHMSEAEYAEVGAKWIAAGADDAAAHFRYRPEELLGLTAGLRKLTDGC
jgi:hypothetical protein